MQVQGTSTFPSGEPGDVRGASPCRDDGVAGLVGQSAALRWAAVVMDRLAGVDPGAVFSVRVNAPSVVPLEVQLLAHAAGQRDRVLRDQGQVASVTACAELLGLPVTVTGDEQAWAASAWLGACGLVAGAELPAGLDGLLFSVTTELTHPDVIDEARGRFPVGSGGFQ